MKKHGTPLPPNNFLRVKGLSEEQVQRMCAQFRQNMAKLRAEQPAHLEALGPLFEEAQGCASGELLRVTADVPGN